MEKKHKSQLAKDLSQALFVCHLRDDLSELVDDATITDERVKRAIYNSYMKVTVLLACAIVDSKDIQGASGRNG
jgi:hypothetical protein